MTTVETIGRFLFIFMGMTLDILQFIIFIVIILSWFRPKDNSFTIWLKKIAYPVLNLARKITPKTGMIDFSPLIALFGIGLIREGIRLAYLQLF